jgi:hypothetical protein
VRVSEETTVTSTIIRAGIRVAGAPLFAPGPAAVDARESLVVRHAQGDRPGRHDRR